MDSKPQGGNSSSSSAPIDIRGHGNSSPEKAHCLTELQRLNQSELRYRRIFESARDGILILDPETRKITDANPYIVTLLAYSKSQVLGKELWEIGLLKDEEGSRDAFRELKAKGFIRYENLPLKALNGQLREVEFVSNVYQEAGDEFIQCNIRDISERRRAQQDTAEKARLLDLSNDAIVVRGLDDKISLWNKGAEKAYGWSAQEAIGQDLHSLLKTEFPRPREEIVAQLQREGQFHGEVVQIARDGQRVISLCRWVLDRKTESILTSYTDISERKQSEEALWQSFAELRLHAEELDRFNRVAVGRELRMAELKMEVNYLCQQAGEPARYLVTLEQDGKDPDACPS